MGAFAGMALTADEVSDMQDCEVGNALSVLDVRVFLRRSSSYILSNAPVMQNSKNNFSNCSIDQETGIQVGWRYLVMWKGQMAAS